MNLPIGNSKILKTINTIGQQFIYISKYVVDLVVI